MFLGRNCARCEVWAVGYLIHYQRLDYVFGGLDSSTVFRRFGFIPFGRADGNPRHNAPTGQFRFEPLS
jgi:hypothetical protein